MAVDKYPEYVKSRFDEIEIWLKKGLSEKQIYTNLSVGKTAWERYKKVHEELRDLLKSGRITQVQEVENALYKNATGFYYYVDDMMKVKDKDGSEKVQVVRLQKFKPPETGAIAFFLKNKASDRYMDNPNMVDLKREELEIRRKESDFKSF